MDQILSDQRKETPKEHIIEEKPPEQNIKHIGSALLEWTNNYNSQQQLKPESSQQLFPKETENTHLVKNNVDNMWCFLHLSGNDVDNDYIIKDYFVRLRIMEAQNIIFILTAIGSGILYDEFKYMGDRSNSAFTYFVLLVISVCSTVSSKNIFKSISCYYFSNPYIEI